MSGAAEHAGASGGGSPPRRATPGSGDRTSARTLKPNLLVLGLNLAALATACIGMAAILAAVISALLYADRPLPRSLPIADALFGVAGLVLHFVAQIGAKIDDDFVIAIPFVTIGVVSGVVLVVRVLRHHRPVRILSLAHAATLVIGLALVIQGLSQEAESLQ